MKTFNPSQFKVENAIKLSELPTMVDLEMSKKQTEKQLRKVRRILGEWQDVMYAHGKYSVLFCLQGIDTSGKDSLIREVFKDFNARGVVVHSFKAPSALELKHDFLWRHYVALPARGKFGVFNRTHYENVLITRVKPHYILNENIPGIESVSDITEEFWNNRFDQINNFEKTIAQNGTIIFKFFLNLSKEEQRQRLLRRLEKPSKNWKFSSDDLKERELWDDYQVVFEDTINRTSKPHAPWYVIPADEKHTARYMVTKIMLDELRKYTDVQNPELSDEDKNNLKHYKAQLSKE
ncbi:polyphosphate kinase 2 family protein [Paucihalobacter ruber]|uniref:Polyphosphate kinase 2 family protein n=1 Tax=Paucihalobacter ruber TaxID=2567861 RepID=A0A506PPD7_9FLAO|nr:PPK2 family polyphosphate kinase [Paucihalobacter ruber]TPV35429.1 polyphosphate kinase 2 family protein [Paucihalobacter ruber]